MNAKICAQLWKCSETNVRVNTPRACCYVQCVSFNKYAPQHSQTLIANISHTEHDVLQLTSPSRPMAHHALTNSRCQPHRRNLSVSARTEPRIFSTIPIPAHLRAARVQARETACILIIRCHRFKYNKQR